MSEKQVATLAGGCFWCLEAVYELMDGVESVVSGYSGGHDPQPTYERVCMGVTGHAEAVQVTFDPDSVSFNEVLDVFFSIHDPTTLNRQDPDVGTQYRSVIFYHNPEQKRISEEVMAELTAQNLWPQPIVTELTELETLHPAEDYHQNYYQSNGNAPYCQVIISPKVAKFRQKYADKVAH